MIFHAGPKRTYQIGAIIDPKDLKQYTTLCADGTYSRSKAPQACVWHGGVKERNVPPPGRTMTVATPQLDAHPAAVNLVPLEKVQFARELFQNREAEYSEESVNRIVEAAETGNFRFEVFDPILLWRNPRGQLIVLSGHSRTEAFNRLSSMGYSDFDRIPAKIIEVSQAEAQRIALESNTLSTRETDAERASYYRMLREQGATGPETDQQARKNEGKDAKRIIAYSYLNPNGLTFTALKALEGKDATSQENIRNVANWIGTARRNYPELSNLHEDEIYRWLTSGAYGKQYTNMRDFLQKLQAVIMQRTEFGRFDPDTALNIQNMSAPTAGEQAYNAQRADLVKNIRDLDKAYKDTIKRLNAANATEADRQRILTPMEMQIRTARQKLVEFEQKATRPSAAAKQELNLFAVSGYRRGSKIRVLNL